MAIATEHPYIDEQGVEHSELIKTYSDTGHTLIQVETATEYEIAIDSYPCKYTYIEKPKDEVAE